MKLLGRIGPYRLEALKLTLFGGTFWFAWAFGCYQGVYLQSKGFSASDMGMFNALSAGINILSVSFWGTVSDRIGSLKKVVLLVLLFGGLLFTIVPLIPTELTISYFLLFFIPPLFNFFRGSMTTVVENMQVRNSNELRLNYGVIRAAGSLFFTVGSLIISWLLTFAVGVEHTFFLSFLLMLLPVTISVFLREPRSGSKRVSKQAKETEENPEAVKPKKAPIKELFKNKSYVAFLIFAFVFYIASSCEGSFVPYYMKSIGINPDRFGIILAYRAFLEMPFLLLMVKMRKRFSLQQLLMLAVIFMGLECLLFAVFAKGLVTMILSTTFFGLGNGLFIGSSMNYLYQLAPDNLKASAQSFFAAVAAVAGIAGNLIGGALFETVGAKPFYFIVFILMFLSVFVFFVSTKLTGKKTTPAN